jgi:nitric oxide reductase NorD protein
MPLSEAYVQDVEARLSKLSPALVEPFRASLAALPADLGDEPGRLLAEEAIALAGHSVRSWEACGDYFRVAPGLLAGLDEASFRGWSASGRNLTDLASAIASAYFRASPGVIPALAGVQVAHWAGLGQQLYKATWKSISLASEFFVVSPELLRGFSLSELGRLVHVLEGISERSADLAAACLDAAPLAVESLDHAELVAFIDFAASISDSAWPEASLYFQRGPDLIRAVEPSQRASYLQLSTRVARRIGRQSYALFAEGTTALREVDPHRHKRFIELGSQLVGASPVAAMSFLKSAPVLAGRLRADELEAWHEVGLDILRGSTEGGEAYFRLESGRAEQMIQSLSARVDLSRVSELLRLYSKALTGANVSVQSVSMLEEKGIGWVSERGPSTEGTAVYLPDFIEQFDNKADNFAIFKVYATHQTAHIEFGSFTFSFRRAGHVLPRRRHQVERERRSEGKVTKRKWLTDMERFFDLFGERQMASDLFAIVEDLRIDRRVHAEYSGIRRAGRLVQERELVRRPEVRSLPLRQAFVENLIRASLDGESTIEWPKPLEPVLARALLTLQSLRSTGAIVEDAAEAALTLYELAEQVPNLPPELLQDLDWENMTEEQLQDLEHQAQDDAAGALDELPEGEEAPYESPQPIEFRGDFKPELVQLLMRMRNEDEDAEDMDLSDLTAEEIKELLEKSVEVDVDMDEFDMSQLTAMLEDLEREAADQLSDEDVPDDVPSAEPPPVQALPPEVKTYFYDEWDFRATDYKPRWCAVRERRLEEGTDDFYEKILRQHSSLVNETQRQFELLKPETFRKLKRLEDGEDIDLDAAIDFMVTKKAGHGEVPKIYWRRNKIERDVAVAFLLDMSASTDEEIDKRKPRNPSDTSDPRRYYQWLAQNRTQQLLEPPKRIIDLEKESLVLLTHALEVIHDRYGIYGFSGYGRENVEYFVIKDLEEPFDDTIRRRIDKVTPIRSTRMGPAIRHTTFKLEQSDAKAKILFLVSDGRPQDHGYGRDRTEKEYAIHDTHKALVEAKHKGIVPFALTVDKEGHDYLGQMCGDIAYEVLGDIELLPSRLPTLYRRLTE